MRPERARLPQEVLRQENHFLFDRKGVSMEAPEYSGEYIVPFLKVLNREKETAHILYSISLGFAFLSSQVSMFPFSESLNQRHLLGGASWAVLS